MTRIGIVTLGCEKNTVDSERYLAQLISHGAEPVDDLSQAEIIVVNTCGFIDAAKKESLDAIVEAGEQKTVGNCNSLVVVGCMVERYRSELVDELREVDLFLGASEMDRLVPALQERGVIDSPVLQHPGVRVYDGSLPHLRYLKASEGCDHGCAFCAIPLMRGKHRSFSREDIIHEAQLLELQGAREVNLVAQDLAHYGRDIRDAAGRLRGESLTGLLESLIAETSLPWIRLLYLYSAGVTPELLELIARERRILSYLDTPIQHGSDAVLKRMRRPERNISIREKVNLARSVIPDVAIRTTCIVGFPGETQEDFEILLELLEELRFDGVGCFTYSPQEGTHAWDMPDDVPEEVKRERQEQVSDLQRALIADKLDALVGSEVEAIVDNVDGEGSEARAWWQAHEVDGVTYLDRALLPGTLVRARIDSTENDYDLRASVAEIISEGLRRVADAPRTRQLPLAVTSVGAYGR